MAIAALLAGCHQRPAAPAHGQTPGDRLETAAISAGIVADPARVDPAGLYAHGDDRLCVASAGDGGYRIGVLVDYDEAQGCRARGTATRTGDRLEVDLSADDDDCRFIARFEGDRIAFPAGVPSACDRRCTGRASFGALTVERVGDAVGEATALHDRSGRSLCD